MGKSARFPSAKLGTTLSTSWPRSRTPANRARTRSNAQKKKVEETVQDAVKQVDQSIASKEKDILDV
jgi:hypothetical protein